MFELYVQPTTNQDFDLHDLAKVLSQMAVFCTYNIDWNEITEPGQKRLDFSGSNIVMTYTVEEEAWLGQQLKLVDEAFRSIPLGENLMDEFMMFSLGVPLSRNYKPAVFRVMLERVRRVFNIHPEFGEFSAAAQQNILRKNSLLGLALYVVRAENLSGIDQIREGMGELDEEVWNTNYSTVFDSPDKFTKISLANMHLLSPEQWSVFSNLLSLTQTLVSDPDFYKLNLLYTLTQPQHDEENRMLFKLNFKYKTILTRRLKWKPDWIRQSVEDPDQLVEKIFYSLDALKGIAQLNEQIMNLSL